MPFVESSALSYLHRLIPLLRFLIVICSLGSCHASLAQQPTTADSDPVRMAEQKLRSIEAASMPGISVLVARDGKVLLEHAIGFADLEKDIPITPSTKFRIGSVTKQFTAAAILKLIEDGQLELDDTLDRFLPNFNRGDQVTIHHLLSHTSGIPSYTDDPKFLSTATEPTTEEDLIASFSRLDFTFDPGEKFHYNNSGYFLLGHIAGKVTGRSLGDYWREQFFIPLQMNDTGVHEPDLNLAREARGYSVDNGKVELALDWDMSRAGGAGAIYSTVSDLFKWNEAIFSGKVISGESLARALTVSDQSRDSMNYGYGWSIQEDRGLRRVSHGGGLHGFQSFLTRYPDQNLTIAVLHNASPAVPEMAPGLVANWLAEIFLAKEMEPARARTTDETVDPNLYDRYVGRYDYGAAVMTISRKGDKLMTRISGQPEFELFPESEAKYFLKVVDAQVEFLFDEQGECVAVKHTQGPLQFRAAKILANESLELSAEQIEIFVGQYDYHSAKMQVTRDGTQLFAQLDGQPRFPIFPVSENTFKWKVVDAKIAFVKDDDGKVVAAMHTQGGVTFRVEKIDAATTRK